MANVLTFTKISNISTYGHSFKVLSVDGNVRFGSREHIPLLITASFLAVLFALFTFNMMFIQILVKMSSWRFFKWVARLQPFFETMTGSSNFKYAFWPGYLLFMRILYVMSQFFLHDQSPSNQLYQASLFAAFPIIFSFLGKKGVYKKWSLNILELLLLVNFVFTSLLVAHRLHHKQYSLAVNITRASVVIALVSFFTCQVKSYIIVKSLKKTITACFTCVLDKCYILHQQDSPPAVVTHTDVTVSSSVPEEQTLLLPAAQGMPHVFRGPFMED